MATDFQRSATRWQKFEELCGILDASLADVSQRVFASERHTVDDKLNRLKDMKSCALEIARVGAEAKGRATACTEMARKLSRDANAVEPVEDVVALFNAGVTEAQGQAERSSLARAPEVVRVGKMLDRLSGKDDDILETTAAGGAGRSMRCPVLNRPIEHPVKSTVCGHVYDVKGVITALYQARGIRDERRFPDGLERVPEEMQAKCAAVGCSHYISAGRMKRDYATELTQRQMQSASARRTSMDVDTDAVDVL